MSRLERDIRELLPEKYAYEARRSAEFTADLSQKLGKPIPASAQRIIDTPHEELVEMRRKDMQEEANHAQNVIDAQYPVVREFLPPHITREDFAQTIRALYHTNSIVIQRDLVRY